MLFLSHFNSGMVKKAKELSESHGGCLSRFGIDLALLPYSSDAVCCDLFTSQDGSGQGNLRMMQTRSSTQTPLVSCGPWRNFLAIFFGTVLFTPGVDRRAGLKTHATIGIAIPLKPITLCVQPPVPWNLHWLFLLATTVQICAFLHELTWAYSRGSCLSKPIRRILFHTK